VIGALLVSALVALTLTPALCSKIMKPHVQGEKPRGMSAWVDARLAALTRVYGRTLSKVIGRGYTLAGVSALVVARLPCSWRRPQVGTHST
jgi:Cation/multidrug efflux pump